MIDFIEGVKIFLTMVFIVLGLALVCFGAISGVDYLFCKSFQRATGYETKWNLECYAKTTDGWVPKDFVFGKAQELRLKQKK